MRYFAASTVALAGVSFAIRDLVAGAPFSAAGFLLLGVLVAAPFIVGFDVRQGALWGGGAGLCGLLGIAHVFFETPGFDIERQEVQLGIYADLVMPALSEGNPWKLSVEEKRIATATMLECAMQGNRDMMQSAVEANSAVHLGPEASLAEATIQALEGKTPEERCLSGFKLLLKSHPTIFDDITTKHGRWLRKHGFLASKV